MSSITNIDELSEKELGLKIGSPDEAFWTNVLKELEVEIQRNEDALKLQNAIREMAEIHLEEAKNEA